MRIVYFYNEEWEKEYVSKKFTQDEFNFIKGSTKDAASIHDTEATVLSVFVNSPVGVAELDRFPNIKLIATRSTGFDHIDLAEAERRGIIVSNVPTYGEHTVAEFAMALLLALSRRITDAYGRIKTTGSFSQDDLRGFDLKGRTIGIIGTGHIGEHMIKMAKGFDMQVVAFDAYPKPELASTLGFRYVAFDELLASSDVISIHAPYNQHTHHMINMENVGKIKHGCYLINTSRGGLVETVALVKGLEEGILAGAGLDVLEEEGQMVDENMLLIAVHPNEENLRTALANHYLIKHPHVIVTAHIAFNTQEAIERILNVTIDNIGAYKNTAPINIVKKSL
jgi:D-lactate dehydrogenase